jgi:hypothetical protein
VAPLVAEDFTARHRGPTSRRGELQLLRAGRQIVTHGGTRLGVGERLGRRTEFRFDVGDEQDLLGEGANLHGSSINQWR